MSLSNFLNLRPVLTTTLAQYGAIGDVRFVCNSPFCTPGLGDFSAPYAKLEQALADNALNPSSGDAIIVLPGHVEDVVDATMLDNLKAGVPIIGIGVGALAPRFRWTTTAAQWQVKVPSAVFANLNLQLGQVAGVVKAISVTALSCRFAFCGMSVTNVSAGGYTDVAIEIGDGALDATFIRNTILGSSTLPVTDGILVNGSPTAPSGLQMHENQMQFAAGALTGLVRITVPAVGCLITSNSWINTGVDTDVTFHLEDVASQGSFINNRSIVTRTAGNANAKGITWAGATPRWSCAGDTCSDTNQANAVVSPAASS